MNSNKSWGKNRCHTRPTKPSEILNQPTRPPRIGSVELNFHALLSSGGGKKRKREREKKKKKKKKK